MKNLIKSDSKKYIPYYLYIDMKNKELFICGFINICGLFFPCYHNQKNCMFINLINGEKINNIEVNVIDYEDYFFQPKKSLFNKIKLFIKRIKNGRL